MWIIPSQEESVQRPQRWGAATQKERRAGELPKEREARKWLMCLDDVTQQHGRQSLGQRAAKASHNGLRSYSHEALSNQ